MRIYLLPVGAEFLDGVGDDQLVYATDDGLGIAEDISKYVVDFDWRPM